MYIKYILNLCSFVYKTNILQNDHQEDFCNSILTKLTRLFLEVPTRNEVLATILLFTNVSKFGKIHLINKREYAVHLI